MSAPTDPPRGDLTLYQSGDGEVRLEVRLEGETVWLSLDQISHLFDRHKSVVSRHLRRIFESGELSRTATVAESATVQREGDRQVERTIEYFNLDAIISVGYRVNSRRGIHFRQWATRTLREHLLRGFTVRSERLQELGIADLEQTVALLARTLDRNALVTDEGRAVLRVVEDYARTWRLLLAYDEDAQERDGERGRGAASSPYTLLMGGGSDRLGREGAA